MTKLAIFDLDGTLLNTIEDLGHSCNHALKMCGHRTLPLEDYNMLVGRGIYNLFRGALPQEARNEEEVLKMKSHFIPYYNEHKADFTKPYQGIPELLEYLENRGTGLAVASNKYQEGTEALVSKFFSDRKFVKVCGQIDGMPIKPDPQIIFGIMKDAGINDLEDVLYIGDSDVDMQTGMNAGVKTVGVTWGFRTKEELAAYNPWLIADTARDILDRLETADR